jgi:tellurite methyltransferase
LTNGGTYDGLYSDREHVPLWGPDPGRLVARIQDWCRTGDVLDVGCGDGKNALFLERLGFAVTGVDISGQALDLLSDRFAAANHVPKGTYTEADIESWLPEGTFDVLLSYGLFHCLRPAHRVERHRLMQTKLRPGGIIVFSTLTDGIPMPQDHRTPDVNLSSPDEVSSLWDGYEVVEETVGHIVESHPPVVPSHRHEVTWVVAKVPA